MRGPAQIRIRVLISCFDELELAEKPPGHLQNCKISLYRLERCVLYYKKRNCKLFMNDVDLYAAVKSWYNNRTMVWDERVMNRSTNHALPGDNLRCWQGRKIFHIFVKSKANARHFSASKAVNILKSSHCFLKNSLSRPPCLLRMCAHKDQRFFSVAHAQSNTNEHGGRCFNKYRKFFSKQS